MKILCLIVLFCANTMAYAESMRCEQSLVSTGDPLFMAEEKCGPPSDKREYSVPATYINKHGRSVVDPDQRAAEHQIWTYNFGPNRLMVRINAINNKIERIETLGYGK
ncbi:MAG: DUF2845 domain-containing protein [Proteobacteria bacterium]|nr:DUF2845 domain-containing protein [Pseudomonadota bacterium]